MIFEKIRTSFPFSWEFISLLVSVALVTAYITYSICLVAGVMGVEAAAATSLLDLISGAAQIATASAFLLAFVQYRKNSNVHRQQIIAGQASFQINRMAEIAGQIQVGDNTSLENLNKSITLLSNIAVGFEELFKSMEEGIEKAIVRVQWQDMYFNELAFALKGLDLIAILSQQENVDFTDIWFATQSSGDECSLTEADRLLQKYFNYKSVLSDPVISQVFTLKGKIESLDTFVMYFMNDSRLGDLLYGLRSRVDIRVRAPLLAVANPSDFALKDHSA